MAEASILWAEDSSDDQQLLQAALAESSVPSGQVAFVGDGVAVLEALRRRRPTLVVLDLKMPRMGGLETLRRIRADTLVQDQRCAVFSSSRRPEELEACHALGVVAFLQKPLDFDGLCKAVRELHGLAAVEAPSTAPSAPPASW